jgi:hypothetical protein
MNKVQKIAQKRLDEIETAGARIKIKLKDLPDDQRVSRWKARLAEYAVSKTALALELKSGVSVKVKDTKQQALLAVMAGGDSVPRPTDGVVVDVPAADLSLEGK